MKLHGFLVIACLVGANAAMAGDGYVTDDVDLRAGPDPGYPTVATLHSGTPVSIQGCVKNWSWCDVVTTNGRGWIAGDFLEQDYEGHRVVVPAFGVQMGIPIITFSFNSYWNEHYRSSAWFHDRARFAKVRPRYAPPMRKPIDPHAGEKATVQHQTRAPTQGAKIAREPAQSGQPQSVASEPTPRQPVAHPVALEANVTARNGTGDNPKNEKHDNNPKQEKRDENAKDEKQKDADTGKHER